ncbi:MAG: CHASE domain-containing protein [Roseateles sp.]|uniref:CHASE domain-containing protein n=1 Tax=Roseateles sp. TaxID=1971397 RepID=UPI0039E7D646
MLRIGRYLALSAGITAVYALLGRLSLLMALPPHQIAPIYPAAGWALAVLLVLGLRYLPAVALGACIVQATSAADPGAGPLAMTLGIGAGAAAQAAVGALLIRRWCGRPALLASPREIGAYLLASALAGFVSPSCATLLLNGAGAIAPGQAGSVWMIWWTGDLMGVLIATPITLALIGQPRAAWATRRFSVGLPMLLTTLLVGLGVAATMEWDRQRLCTDFTRDATAAAQDLSSRLRESLLALEGAHGLVKVKPLPTRREFARATSGFLGEDSPLIALGLALRVPRAEQAHFDAAAMAGDFPAGYHARDRTRSDDLGVPPDEDLLAIRLVEPLSRNAGALGTNVRSIAGARAAVEQAAALGRPVASAGFPLSQDRSGPPGVVIYQPLYRQAGPDGRQLEGVVFATLRPDLLLSRLAAGWPAHLGACLVDLEPGAAFPRLGGPRGCEAVTRGADAALPLVKMPLAFAGRQWEVRIHDLPGPPPAPGRSWAFALVGLLTTATVGTLLLLLSGRTQHVEALVGERTAALEREIAHRALGEQALSQSEQRFRNIFDTAPIGIVFTDVHGGIQEVNPYFCAMVGCGADALLGRRTLDLTHPDEHQEDLRQGRRLLRGEIPYSLRRTRYLRADGSAVHARALVSLLRGSDDRPDRLVGVVEDITDQLRIEELDRARQAAEAASQAKNEFLSRMSHELRTPMNAILGFTQLMQMDAAEPLAPAQRGRAEQIAQAGWHLLEMINDTLDLSRIESGSLRLEPAALALPPLLARALALVQQGAAERGLAVAQRLDPDALQLLGDATRVTQILTNLLSNAVKYNRAGGSIAIEATRPEPGWVEVAVRDTGLGLSDEQRAALFQPFNRLGRERSGLPGAGIGLVISRRLAEMMGGSLRAEAADAGACFVLRLPAADAAAPPAALPASGAPVLPRPAAHRQVLYVEDNPLNAEVMRGILAQRPGLALEVVPTVADGLRALAGRLPALLLLDWHLPDGLGLDLLQRLPELRGPDGGLPPVIVVSANAQPEQIAAAHAAGARHYLTKPLDVRELLALIDELLAAPAEARRAE